MFAIQFCTFFKVNSFSPSQKLLGTLALALTLNSFSTPVYAGDPEEERHTKRQKTCRGTSNPTALSSDQASFSPSPISNTCNRKRGRLDIKGTAPTTLHTSMDIAEGNLKENREQNLSPATVTTTTTFMDRGEEILTGTTTPGSSTFPMDTEKSPKKQGLLNLPPELLFKILLDVPSLNSVAQTCKDLYFAANDPMLNRERLREERLRVSLRGSFGGLIRSEEYDNTNKEGLEQIFSCIHSLEPARGTLDLKTASRLVKIVHYGRLEDAAVFLKKALKNEVITLLQSVTLLDVVRKSLTQRRVRANYTGTNLDTVNKGIKIVYNPLKQRRIHRGQEIIPRFQRVI